MSHHTEDPSALRSEIDAIRAANNQLQHQLAESQIEIAALRTDLAKARSERDYAEEFKTKIWKVTTPCETDTCILTLKEMGAQEAKDRCAAAFLAGAKWWEWKSTGAQLEIARGAVKLRGEALMEVAAFLPSHDSQLGNLRRLAISALEATGPILDPAAALAEHDKRVAERCVEILTQSLNFMREVSGTPCAYGSALSNVAKTAIRREFRIGEKPSTPKPE